MRRALAIGAPPEKIALPRRWGGRKTLDSLLRAPNPDAQPHSKLADQLGARQRSRLVWHLGSECLVQACLVVVEADRCSRRVLAPEDRTGSGDSPCGSTGCAGASRCLQLYPYLGDYIVGVCACIAPERSNRGHIDTGSYHVT
ncbi:hypothetical protein [Rhodocyclus gracilis]|uniref:Uncharacterized protein n=1 Tax=Rhodocyclus tenuis TaxID=1066 RepID=A0A6L5JYW9_RHOTE|nr:hypothetical protein [Rhodocyclus gracilis]MQY52535.1 hypothetical protein [Rhodocyclus gracilis]